MAKEAFRRDDNYMPVIGGVTDDSAQETKQLRVDPTTLRLKVDSNSSDGCASVGTGRTAHDGEGAWQMSDISCKRVWIQSLPANGELTNGGIVVIGGSSVVAAEATRQGKAILPSQGEWFNVSNLNLLYIDVTDAGTVIHWYYES